MAGKAQKTMEPTGNPGSYVPGAAEIKTLTIEVVSDSMALREGLSQIANTQSAGPLDFQFWSRADGLQPLLEPGLDAVVVDIAMGNDADLAFLRQVIALGPNA